METRQSAVSRLDENVIITMLAVSVLAVIVFGFRYKNYQPCPVFSIRTSAANYRTGEVVHFETDVKAFQKLQWKFGDNQGNDTKTGSSFHTYDQPGEYTVTLSVDNNCTQYKTLVISQAPKVVNPLLIPTFAYPQTAVVGVPIVFKDNTKGAQKWEWRFGETATIDATSGNPTYVYNSPGLKTVSLLVNGDQQQYAEAKIFVNEAPPRPTNKPNGGSGGGGPKLIVIPERPTNNSIGQASIEPPPNTPDITEEQLEAELRQVANKLRTAENFSSYLCGDLNVPVSLNGSKTTFTDLCKQLQKFKNDSKIKQLSVQIVRDQHCIQALMVTLKKKENIFQKVF